MKKIILSILLMITLCSCSENNRETIYVGEWSMTFLNDSSILAIPRFESNIQKPYIIKIK